MESYMSEDYVKSSMFPLPSVELDLEKSEKRGKKIPKVRQAAFSSPAVQGGKAQCDK